MNKQQTILYIVFLVLLSIIITRHINKDNKTDINVPTIDNRPKPVVVPVTIPNNKPEHLGLVCDDIDQAEKIAKFYNKKLILIFSAEWCLYCKKLKSDIENLKDKDKYILCLVDINKNKIIADKYKVKILPTSIVLKDNIEQERISGYNKNDYINWLRSL